MYTHATDLSSWKLGLLVRTLLDMCPSIEPSAMLIDPEKKPEGRESPAPL